VRWRSGIGVRQEWVWGGSAFEVEGWWGWGVWGRGSAGVVVVVGGAIVLGLVGIVGLDGTNLLGGFNLRGGGDVGLVEGALEGVGGLGEFAALAGALGVAGAGVHAGDSRWDDGADGGHDAEIGQSRASASGAGGQWHTSALERGAEALQQVCVAGGVEGEGGIGPDGGRVEPDGLGAEVGGFGFVAWEDVGVEGGFEVAEDFVVEAERVAESDHGVTEEGEIGEEACASVVGQIVEGGDDGVGEEEAVAAEELGIAHDGPT